jgi:ABC-2 type transport system ATP-binding protein
VTDSVIQIRHLSKRFGSLVALDDVSLDIARGEIFALLGPNGAGKTTLIGIVAGLTRRTSGEVLVGGADVTAEYRKARRVIGLVPQEINFDPFFSVEEALRFQAGYFGVALSEERLVELLRALGLLDKRKANTRTLSGGMKRRLMIAKALAHDPDVLFLDEPTAGVDVELRRDLWTYVRQLRDNGKTIVLTTHYLEEAEELADRVGIIDHGKVQLVEAKTTLLQRLGTRVLTLRLAVPVAELPEQIIAGASARHCCRAADSGRRYSGAPPGGSLHPAAESGAGFMKAQPSLGFLTLLRKEVTRFLRVPGQTLLSPLVTTTLYFIVFGFTVNVRTPMVNGESYARFIVPGLIMLGVVSNSFLNSSSSMFVMKIQGTIVDLLVTPMTYMEILGAFVLAAVIRGLMVGAATWLVAACFTSFDVSHPLLTIVFILLVASSFGTLGVLTGIWAEKFEQVNLIPTFLITPRGRALRNPGAQRRRARHRVGGAHRHECGHAVCRPPLVEIRLQAEVIGSASEDG